MTRRSCLLLVAVLLLTAGAAETEAQQRRGRQTEEARWAPPAIGVRFGWDQRVQQEVLGAQIRVPVLRSGIVEIVPSADVTFLPVEKEYQYSVEAAWVSGGARGGLLVQAGVGWRSTASATDIPGERETLFGYVLGVGGKTPVGPVQVELGLRWIFLEDSFRRSLASVGINLPLWSAGDETRPR